MAKNKGIIVDYNRIEREVWALTEPLVASAGAELIDVEYTQEAGSWYLRLFIDREPPVDHDLCEQVSNIVSDPLDGVDSIKQSYYLEISSPGLERPLKREQDFKRFAGRKISVRLYAPRGGEKVFLGILRGLIAGEIVLEQGGEEQRFSIADVAKAHLLLEDKG